MTRHDQILYVLAATCLCWQIALIVVGAAYARAGRTVNVGVMPGLFSMALVIAAICW